VDEVVEILVAGPQPLINVSGLEYRRVCGNVRGYQSRATFAFIRDFGIESRYVDGVSLTYGAPGYRKHIWTFASSLSQVYDETNRFHFEYYFCSCIEKAGKPIPNGTPVPTFVGDDYFCDSGENRLFVGQLLFHPNDPLWDDENCPAGCCKNQVPPYFTKVLPAPTTDNIELRICSSHLNFYGEHVTPIDQVELYVK